MAKIFCSICLEDVKDPLALVCGHVICYNDVITLIQKRTRKCPICRTRITWTIPQLNNAQHPQGVNERNNNDRDRIEGAHDHKR